MPNFNEDTPQSIEVVYARKLASALSQVELLLEFSSDIPKRLNQPYELRGELAEIGIPESEKPLLLGEVLKFVSIQLKDNLNYLSDSEKVAVERVLLKTDIYLSTF